jgi:phospholipid/cholesterol/gamma-HCH transport system substrate-binding protein
MQREIKTGLLMITALGVLAASAFLVGEKNHLLQRKNQYFVQFQTVSGLAKGSPVELSGVNVGTVDDVVLPEGVDDEFLTIWISLERRYEDRIRADSVARIKTIGLLGDKYIEVTSGSRESAVVLSGGQIQTAPATDVDKLIASGEDAVENFVAISVSLRGILGRMEAGEGILGQLTTDNEAGERAKEGFLAIVDSLENIVWKIENGEGTLASLINDGSLANRLHGVVDHIEGILATVDTGEGILPTLLNDSGTRDRLVETLQSLSDTAGEVASVSAQFSEGEGLLHKLLGDEEYGRKISTDLNDLVENLKRLSEKLDGGNGTLGQFLENPEAYEALNDVLVGINESKTLRWLIRNRQKKGIKKRYRAEQSALDAQDESDTSNSSTGSTTN